MNRLKIRSYKSKYNPLLKDLEQGSRQVEEFFRHVTESVEYLDVFVASGSKRPEDYDAAVDAFDDAIKNYARYCTDGLRGKANSKFPKYTSAQKMQREILSLQKDLLDIDIPVDSVTKKRECIDRDYRTKGNQIIRNLCMCPKPRVNAGTKLQERLA